MARPTHGEIIDRLQTELNSLKASYETLRGELDRGRLTELRDLVNRLDERVKSLEKGREEAEKRQWQFVYIFAGAMASVLVTVIVQLVLAQVKK